MSPNYKPKDTQDLIPYLIVEDVDGLIDFLKKTFDAELLDRMAGEDGRVMHASAKIGDCVIMMGGSSEKSQQFPAMLYVYVKDVDSTYKKAIEAGAEVVRELENQFYGDRSGGVKDPWGNSWWFSTQVEQLSDEEMQKRHDEYVKSQK